MNALLKFSANMYRIAIATFALSVLGQTALTASAADQVGEARRIVNSVTGSGAAGQRKLAVEAPVYRDEAINAAAASHGELQLHDGSRVIVGENSTVSLDNFVVSGSSFSAGTAKVTKGAFRFISGGSGKEAISIKTPRATIGIRGTVVDVYVEPGTGDEYTVLISGQVTVCSGGDCITTKRACDIIRVDAGGGVSQMPFLHSAQWTADEEAKLFGLTSNQQNFSPEWRAFEGGCFARAAEEAKAGVPADTGVGPGAPPPLAPPFVPPPVVVIDDYDDDCEGPCL